MAALLILAIAADRKIRMMRKSRQQIQFPASIGLVHLVLKLPRERRPGPLIRRRQRLFHQFWTRRKIWKPHVIIVELRKISLRNPARRSPHRADPQIFVSLTWRTESDDKNSHYFTKINA